MIFRIILSTILIAITAPLSVAQKTNIQFNILKKGDIVIKEGENTSSFSYVQFPNRTPKKFTLILTGKATFLDKTKKKVAYTKNSILSIPPIKSSKKFDESTLNIKLRGKTFIKNIRVYTHPKNMYESLKENLKNMESAISLYRNNFSIIDYKQLTKIIDKEFAETGRLPLQMKEDGIESITIDPSPNSSVQEAREKLSLIGPCTIRPFLPGTRYRYGQIIWANHPRRAGFSVKGEFQNTEWVRDLQCPSGPYKTQNYADGIYRKNWYFVAYKIPDHCTARREFINGKWASRCCCNVLMTNFGYGTCGPVDARKLNGWPNGAKTCSRKRKIKFDEGRKCTERC